MENENYYNKFIEKYCKKCANKDNKQDLCNIMKNIDGKLQCVNYAENIKLTLINRDKLFKLMKDNPELPIVFYCSSDELIDDNYRTFYNNFNCEICDIYETDEIIFDNKIDITEYYEDLYCDYEGLSDKEFDKKIQKLVEKTPHYKAIAVYCNYYDKK